MYKSMEKRKIISAIFAFIAVMATFTGCNKTTRTFDRVYFDFLGTTVYLEIHATNRFPWQKDGIDQCFETVGERLDEISSTFSVEDEGSFVCKFNELNKGESIEVSEDFLRVFNLAVETYDETMGAFNPAVKPLVDLWGFSKKYQLSTYSPTFNFDRVRNEDGSFSPPKQEYVDAFLLLSDFSTISVEETIITKNAESVTVDGVNYRQQIDLSGVAKGYAGDEIARILKDCGYDRFYVSIGTSSMYLSKNAEGSAYKVGLTDPLEPDAPSKDFISVCSGGVSTSGVYQNCYYVDGRRFHHIIDGKTGRPSETDVLSATVWYSDDCFSSAKADALSTAFVVMGSEEAREYAENNGWNYAIVTNDEVIGSGIIA